MAVPEGPTEKRYTGNGVTKIFTIPFLLLAATDLDVYVDGVEVFSGFTITGAGSPESTITFDTAPASLADIYLQLDVPFERLNDYQENGDFLSSTVNRDFDRIWQALKQLLRWSTRSLRLGDFDVDGLGWYRAKGNGIRDLRDPVDMQDAATKHYTQTYLAQILSALTGPINNAANVLFVDRNGLPKVVQDLSTNAGQMIGVGGESLDSAFSRRDAKIAAAQSGLTQLSTSGTVLVDLHYAICRGTGWWGGEVGTIYTRPALAAVAKGGYIVNIANTLGFFIGQLVVYQASNGEYYTATIGDLVVDTSLIFSSPTEYSISAGNLVSNFYTDGIHPNLHGYRAIADAAIRTIGQQHLRVWNWATSDTIPVAGGVVSSYADNTYANPGGVATPSVLCVAAAVGGGWKTAPVSLKAGDYVMRVRVTAEAVGPLRPLRLQVIESSTTSDVGYIEIVSLRPTVVEIPFHARKGGQYVFQVQGSVAGQVFAVSKVEILRTNVRARSLDFGVHVLLGDSWFNLPGIIERLQERWPNATFINKGVQGHKISDMVSRYDADVTPYNPDVVWLMGGTNDSVANTAPTAFYTGVGIISAKTAALGAELICFNTSVGPYNHPEWSTELLSRSRALVFTEDYLPEL